MTTTHRIGLLSNAIREQINHRLLNGDSDLVVLKWLLTLGEVWALIQQQLQNAAFTTTDLGEWRTSGFAEWKLRREVALAAQAPGPDYSTDGQLKTSARQLADQLAENLAGYYARLMHNWDGEATQEFTARLRALTHLCRDICALRKSEHQAALIKLAEAKHALRQKQFAEETDAIFLKRLDQPGMRERILNHYNNIPSPAPSAQSPEPTAPAQSPRPTPQSDSIKPNQASSGVGMARPDLASPAAPALPEPSAQSPEPTAPSPGLGTQSQSLVRPNQTKSRDSKVTSNVLPGDPGYVEDDAPDIYSRPNPAIAARQPKKEEPIVRGFVSMVNYDRFEHRNDVHY